VEHCNKNIGLCKVDERKQNEPSDIDDEIPDGSEAEGEINNPTLRYSRNMTYKLFWFV
jgi:hypothetical protein